MNYECLKLGHRLRVIDGKKENLAYQKGERQIFYFEGRYEWCTREPCHYEKYTGPTRPIAKEEVDERKS